MAQPVCDACYAGLPWLPDARCPQCALPTADGGICGTCLSYPPRFDRVSAAFVYAWPLAPLIHHYKYAGNLALATLLAQALSARLTGDADLIIPMPLAANACRRVRDTAPQASLPWRERAQNIRGAFVCDADLQGKRVAVIDDVMTTGATLNELARNLRQGGALEVQGWMVARTL